MNFKNLIVILGTTATLSLTACGTIESGVSQNCDQVAQKLLSSAYKYATENNTNYIEEASGQKDENGNVLVYKIDNSGKITQHSPSEIQHIIIPAELLLKNDSAISCKIADVFRLYRVTETKDNIKWVRLN